MFDYTIDTFRNINWSHLQGEQKDFVTQSKLWKFHNAIDTKVKKSGEGYHKKLWALASIKSLIEIRYNKSYVAFMGVIYETESDTPFNLFRKRQRENPNFVSGDQYKGDVLRTSRMKVYRDGKITYDYVSYHPSVSFPIEKTIPHGQQTKEKQKKIEEYFNTMDGLWERINSLPNETAKINVLNNFVEHIKYTGVGCANERLQEAIIYTVQQIAQEEDKILGALKVTCDELAEDYQKLKIGEDLSPEEVYKRFNRLFNNHKNASLIYKQWFIPVQPEQYPNLVGVLLEDFKDRLWVIDAKEQEAIKQKYFEGKARLEETKEESVNMDVAASMPEHKTQIILPYCDDEGNTIDSLKYENGKLTIDGKNDSGQSRTVYINLSAGKYDCGKFGKGGYWAHSIVSNAKKLKLLSLKIGLPYYDAEKNSIDSLKYQKGMLTIQGRNDSGQHRTVYIDLLTGEYGCGKFGKGGYWAESIVSYARDLNLLVLPVVADIHKSKPVTKAKADHVEVAGADHKISMDIAASAPDCGTQVKLLYYDDEGNSIDSLKYENGKLTIEGRNDSGQSRTVYINLTTLTYHCGDYKPGRWANKTVSNAKDLNLLVPPKAGSLISSSKSSFFSSNMQPNAPTDIDNDSCETSLKPT